MNPRTMKAIIGASALALVLAACANGGSEQAVAANPIADSSATDPAEGVDQVATIDVKSGVSAIGDLLVGPDGLTLYAFTNDIDAVSACYGTCADAWPPVIVSTDWTAGPGLDFGIFATTERDDGQLQLVAGQWPLYYFAGDGAPGDLKGQGSGDVWFAVDLDGRLIRDSAPAAAAAASDDDGDEQDEPADDPISDAQVSSRATDLGEAIVDEAGLTLYGFLNDRDGSPTCNDACADAWPPLLVETGDLPAGLDSTVFSVVQRDDGTWQLQAGAWPLYRFAGDASAGDVNGQGSGDVWFVAAPDGSLIGAPEAEDDGY